jgi:hypothetical protein
MLKLNLYFLTPCSKRDHNFLRISPPQKKRPFSKNENGRFSERYLKNLNFQPGIGKQGLAQNNLGRFKIVDHLFG